MKCKSWSNKINNFVVRRLKSIKINGQQQQQSTTVTQQQQQQHLSTTCSTMPAMPKENAATAVSLSESDFSELKLKELATSAAVVVATAAAMASTASVTGTGATNAASANRLQSHHSHYQPQQQTRSNTCGCGAVSAATTSSSSSGSSSNSGSDVVDGYNPRNYWTNGYSTPAPSPLAAAAGEPQKTGTSPQRHSGSSNSSGSGSNSRSCSCNRVSAAAPNPAAVTPPRRSANDYIFGKYIGEGSFSTVYLAVDVQTRREYAIKVCEKRHILREHKQEYVRREREVMHQLTNVPGFVNLSCTFQDNRSLYFVMTYAENGDLLPYINKVGSFDVDCTRHYAAEILLSCEQMHQHNIVHRDLKPENILLDEDMHTLIADFGSAKILSEEDRLAATAACATTVGSNNNSTQSQRSRSRTRQQYLANDDTDEERRSVGEDGEADDDTGSDDVDSPSRQPRYQRQRRGSFVGTAQYVSPEVLQNGPITPAADLWALGCIIYQMVSGLPPFRANSDYAIFRQILAGKLDFPEGFDADAENLVRKLLKVNPQERLGAQDLGDQYTSIRAHPFFSSVNFKLVREQTPPTICPYLPGVDKDEHFSMAYHALEHLEPGLDDKQITRLLGAELGTPLGGSGGFIMNNGSQKIEKKTEARNIFDLTEEEKRKRLEQQKSDKWHVFADNEVILKKGYINKRKGLFARRRMLLLTTGPRLIYIDPVQMIKKGEIPWSAELHVEPKNFKIFFVHTPNRTYYLEDPEGYALRWNDAIDNMHQHTYKTLAPLALPVAATATAAASRTRGHCSVSAVGSATTTCGNKCSSTATQVKTA